MARKLMMNKNDILNLTPKNPLRTLEISSRCIDSNNFIFEMTDTGWVNASLNKIIFKEGSSYRVHFKLIESTIIGTPIIAFPDLWCFKSNYKVEGTSILMHDKIPQVIINGTTDEVMSEIIPYSSIVSPSTCVTTNNIIMTQFKNSITNSKIKFQMYIEEIS